MSNYALRGITYQIPADEREDIEKAVLRDAELDYLEKQRLEAEENALMIEADCEDEVTHLYEAPFSKDLPMVRLDMEAKVQEYYRNAHNLLSTMIVDIEANGQIVDGDTIQMSVEGSYKCKIESFEDASAATKKEVIKDTQYKAISKILQDEKFKDILVLKNTLKTYSPNNLALIIRQKPDVEFVRGMKAWNDDYNRSVNQGTKAIKILSLCHKKLTTEAEVREDYKYNKWRGKEWLEKTIDEVRKGKPYEYSYFRDNYVFDISDTHITDPSKGDPYYETKNAYESALKLHGDKKIYEVTKDIISGEGIPTCGFDGTLKSIYNNLLEYADEVLSKNPDSVPGIKTRIALNGVSHEIETLFAVGSIALELGLPLEDKISKEIGLAFEKGKYLDKVKTFAMCMDRGYALAKQFCEKTLDAMENDKKLKKEMVKE